MRGHSRELNTKIHLAVDARGMPVRFLSQMLKRVVNKAWVRTAGFDEKSTTLTSKFNKNAEFAFKIARKQFMSIMEGVLLKIR